MVPVAQPKPTTDQDVTRTQWRAHLDIVATRMPGDLGKSRVDLAKAVVGYLRAAGVASKRRDERARRDLNRARGKLLTFPGSNRAWVEHWDVLPPNLPSATNYPTLAAWLQIAAG
jgi:hypothetical protein